MGMIDGGRITRDVRGVDSENCSVSSEAGCEVAGVGLGDTRRPDCAAVPATRNSRRMSDETADLISSDLYRSYPLFDALGEASVRFHFAAHSHDSHALACQTVPDSKREFDRVAAVAVQAYGFSSDGNCSAVS